MEYATQYELYKQLLPAFRVKQRLISISRYKSITNENIWSYLIKSKWKQSVNLSLSEIVNDIITIDLDIINKDIGGHYE